MLDGLINSIKHMILQKIDICINIKLYQWINIAEVDYGDLEEVA